MFTKNVKIGLALGGGGAKGSAHVGVMKVFDKYGIKPYAIAGTSAGSMLGAAFALGLSTDEVLKRSEKFNSNKFTKISNFSPFGESLIKDKDINNVLQSVLGDADFKDCKIPFYCVAVDLESGKEVILDSGKLWEACRASSAIPFIFTPVFLNSQYMVDGGILNNVPVDVLKERVPDIDITIGIELGSMTSRQYISGIVWKKYYSKPKAFKLAPGFFAKLKMNTTLMAHVMLRAIDIMREQTQEARFAASKPDIIIRPKTEDISLLDFDRYREAVQAGIDAAEEAVPAILELIEKKKNQLNA